MSITYFPPELLDYVINLLHDEPATLRNCCLVSKPWVPRTRKHLFTYVQFDTKEDLESWKKTFPDPSTSPAHYAKTLFLGCPHVFMAADAEAGGWIRGFSRVGNLILGSQGTHGDESDVFLVPLQGLSPVVRSLSMECATCSSQRILDLILSFPLLEDLAVTNYNYVAINEHDGSNGLPTAALPSNPPVFSGCLKLVMTGLAPIVRQLLSLPGGIRFRKFTLAWDRGEDVSLITALVERCSGTLESLDITCDPLGASIWRLRPYR